MEKLNIKFPIVLIFCLLIIINANARNLGGEKDELELDYICLINEKLTKIHYYAQDLAGGPNATVYEVARAAVSGDELLSFGKVMVVDDLLTAGPDPGSEVVGRSQGIVTSSDMRTTAPALSFNVVFTSGRYNGSTISIAGRNEVWATDRRLAVVGGTGMFRFARGYASLENNSSVVGEDLKTYYLVIEYTIYTTYCEM